MKQTCFVTALKRKVFVKKKANIITIKIHLIELMFQLMALISKENQVWITESTKYLAVKCSTMLVPNYRCFELNKLHSLLFVCLFLI